MLFAHVIPVCESVYQKLIIKMLIHSWNSNLDVCRVFHTCKATDTVLILHLIVGVGESLNYVQDQPMFIQCIVFAWN